MKENTKVQNKDSVPDMTRKFLFVSFLKLHFVHGEAGWRQRAPWSWPPRPTE